MVLNAFSITNSVLRYRDKKARHSYVLATYGNTRRRCYCKICDQFVSSWCGKWPKTNQAYRDEVEHLEVHMDDIRAYCNINGFDGYSAAAMIAWEDK